jgi:class 3 adenylate cyclase
MSTETRAISVLFADICGSSRLYEKLGDTEALRALERCLHRMERAAEAAKGRIIKTVGDELMVAFDSAEAATQAAGEIQQRVDALPPVSGVSLAIRIGFHHGDVIEENNDVFGDSVNIASRLASLAKAGQVLTTAETVALMPDELRERTRPIEALTVKGKDNDVDVWEVLWNRGDEDLTMRFSAQPPAVKDTRLHLRHGEDELWLAASRPNASFGRDPNADLITRDSRASRSHGRIERRRDKYVLIDESTNGTYVKFQGEPELVLRREEVILRGRGHIAFGHSTDDDGDGRIEFEVVVGFAKADKAETAGP